MADAVIVNVEVGSRPYYIHGPGLLRRSRLLGLDSGALGLASPSKSLDPRLSLPTLKERTFSDLGAPFE
jgi:hypothetical protein